MKFLRNRDVNSSLISLTALRVMVQREIEDEETLGKCMNAIADVAYTLGGDEGCRRVERACRQWLKEERRRNGNNISQTTWRGEKEEALINTIQ